MNDALRAALDPVILALLDRQPDHGYSLIRRIRDATGQDLSDGSVYPALYRLEAAGKIEGRWQASENARERKTFNLTPKGRSHLKKARSEWPAFATTISSLLCPTAEAH
jgi:DNA-binding PadR family transcriptional regulator